MNNLPKVITWQCIGMESNQGFQGHQFYTLNIRHVAVKGLMMSVSCLIVLSVFTN